MRQHAAMQDLECVYPALPRLRHLIYAQGTTVNLKSKSTIDKLPMFEDPQAPDLGDVSYLLRPNYDRSLLAALLPPELVESSLLAMRRPMEAILHGAEQRCAANSALDWSAFYNLHNPDHTRVVISNPSITHDLGVFLRTTAFSQVLLLVADEVPPCSRASPVELPCLRESAETLQRQARRAPRHPALHAERACLLLP